jgi:hypothetical protein
VPARAEWARAPLRSLSAVLGGPESRSDRPRRHVSSLRPNAAESAVVSRMSVCEPDVVDAIGTSRESGRVVLLVSDHLGWDAETDEHVIALEAKLQRYVDFIRSGQLQQEYPKAAGREAEIEVVLMVPADVRGEAWLESARAQLEAAGVVLSWNVLPPEYAS